MQKLLRHLLSGTSVSILGVGVEEEKTGSFAGLIEKVLITLGQIIDDQKDLKVNLSYALFGISDSSCIDLLDYSRKELLEVETLKEWSVLDVVESVEPVIRAVQQGYSLPCVLLLRLFVKSNDETLPGAMSTVMLADLGSTSAGAPLEKSFAQLRSTILTMDQPIIRSVAPEPTTFLGALVGNCFGGDMHTLVIADIPKMAIARNLQSFVQFLDAMRRIKNHPAPMLETPEMLELGALVEAHGKLEVEHRAVRRELKQLRQALKVTESQREELMQKGQNSQVNNERKHWELEYKMTRLNMEKIQVHERIRQCEIDLVCMEHERLLLLAEMEIKQRQLCELETRLRSSVNEKEKIKMEMGAEVTGLSNKLDTAQKQLENTEKEKQTLKINLNTASEKISTLESRISEIEKAKIKAEDRLESKTADGAKQIEVKSNELAKLKEELSRARSNESNLQGKLTELERATGTYMSVVQDLETKLSVLKIENVTLQAKLEVLSKAPQSPEVSRTIKLMEEKWREERSAMQSVMSDLRTLVGEKSKNFLVPETTVIPPVTKKVKIEESSIGSIPKRERPKKSILAEVESEYLENDEEVAKAPVARVGKKKPIQVKPTAPIKSVEKEISVKKTLAKQDQRIKAPPPSKEIETQTIAPKLEKVKLGRSIKKQSKQEDPIGKILEGEDKDEKEVVIPGTPQKVSPTKTWKPSAFIPGLTRKTENGNVFANLSFAGDNNGFRKRIKLPERIKASTPDGEEMAPRRNVDPNVFSTIMTSFNVPSTGLKK
jgi:hypothetical protein